jgi:hypothetical protein
MPTNVRKGLSLMAILFLLAALCPVQKELRLWDTGTRVWVSTSVLALIAVSNLLGRFEHN